MKNPPLSLICMTAAGLIAPALQAGDGRIPVSAAPATLNTPGVYYLTRDLNAAGGTAITITASPVTLDLNGHTISNNATAISANDQAQVTIRNGTINVTGGFYSVNLSVSGAVSRSSIRVEDLTISGSILFVGNLGTSTPMEVRLQRNTVTNAGGGMVVFGAGAGQVTDNHLFGCTSGSNALEVEFSAGLDISRNTISGCSGIGLMNTVNSQVAYNVISGGNGNGVQLLTGSNRNSVVRNTATGSTGGTPNSGNGIFIENSQSNTISGNQCSGNSQYGIYFSGGITGNSYTGNSMLGNGAGGIFGSAGNQSGGGNCNGTTCS